MQYFTYWTPEGDPRARFGSAPLARKGCRAPLYRHAHDANRYLGVIGEALLPLGSESVVRERTRRLPRGAKAFEPDDYVRAVDGSPVILGRFRDPATPTERHIFVANHSFASKATSPLKLTYAVREIHEVSRMTGRRVPVDLGGSRDLRFSIEPGKARLFVLRTG